MKSEYKIIDNVLSEELYTATKNNFLEYSKFPWFYNNFKVSHTEPFHLNNYQFTHMFYNDYSIRSELFQIVEPIVKYLNPESLIRIKANLVPKTEFRHVFEYHTDTLSKSNGRKTAIYYVNSNNGVTILEDGTEIESIGNRLVIFDQKISHTGTTCTNEKVRCLINFNYIEHEND
jgi:hypothetical protein